MSIQMSKFGIVAIINQPYIAICNNPINVDLLVCLDENTNTDQLLAWHKVQVEHDEF